ncbi:photoreceptor ankyrin repeat protein isoform X2 [Brienomyrus brachyistius]|nr:photoreceptor ankyrin repeat protein isoform X2 [Brienomyrus brachyistius]XP_048873908.1 photoreceptor ankyrin repeat protein isoform X2 [Brienomyrus brachyistius]
MAHIHTPATEDPHLGLGLLDDSSEVSISQDESDSGSLLSDYSILPDYERAKHWSCPGTTLYEACARNEALTVRRVLERGVTQAEVMELDINGRNGLMLAACEGFVDIVLELYHCPFLDVNHRDNDGNTALMMASQAGFITIVNYILNYFSGVDLEVRDTRGFTALIKAAMQGRDDCVTALVMAGANVNAVDTAKGRIAEDWALKTGRFETFQKLRRLMTQPCAEQFCERYTPEWADLNELVAKATAAKTKGEQLAQFLQSTFTISFPRDPQDNGVLDHMVRITTSIHSPLVVTGCRPLHLTSPPEVGKRRMAGPELAQQSTKSKQREPSLISAMESPVSSTSSIPLTSSSSDTQPNVLRFSIACSSVRSYLPRHLGRHNSIFPTSSIPQIKVIKSGERTPKKEKKKKMSKRHLKPPVWKYKEAKEKEEKERLNVEQEALIKEKNHKTQRTEKVKH